MREHSYFVYFVTNKFGNVLYVGYTNDLLRRVKEHRDKKIPGFTARYNVSKLVYFEQTDYLYGAQLREKQIKGWTRAKKEALIHSLNPQREDLFDKLQGA